MEKRTQETTAPILKVLVIFRGRLVKGMEVRCGLEGFVYADLLWYGSINLYHNRAQLDVYTHFPRRSPAASYKRGSASLVAGSRHDIMARILFFSPGHFSSHLAVK